MEQTKKVKKVKEVDEVVPPQKKSKIRLYWDKYPTEGTIVNMRQVLK